MQTVEINGTAYPLKYGAKALSEVLKLADAKGLKGLAKIDEIDPDKWAAFVHAGLKTACRMQEIKTPSLKEVEEAVEANIGIFITATVQLGEDLAGDKKPNTEGN